jgi:uncharacterized protein with HEPN domain
MSPSTIEYLQHILNETEYLIQSSTGLTNQEFLKNETLKRAYVRSFEVIGEAVKQLPTSLREDNSKIEWKSIAGMRDRLIHNYFGVDYEIVWDAIVNKISSLDAEVRKMIIHNK